jgi:uridine kinase
VTVRPFIVGLAGGTASGKSTIAEAAARALDAVLLQHDRYYRDAPDPASHDFDSPEALETSLLVQHLDALRAGRGVDAPVYDFAVHRRSSRHERIEPASVVIVDGILVLADPGVVARCDLTVYVHADDDLRLARRIIRDVAQRGRTAEGVIRQWLTTVRPAHRRWIEPCRDAAMLVLDGEANPALSVGRLVDAIAGRSAGGVAGG